MAKQIGLVKYNGTMGGVRHFKIKGLTGDFAGMIGGSSGDQILSAPEFERTSENMNEFGGCATAGKSILVGLSQVVKQMSDPQMTGRLTRIIKRINLEDQTEARGYRAILISQEKQYLTGFSFDKNVSLEGVFTAPYTLSNAVARDTAKHSEAPEGHCQLCQYHKRNIKRFIGNAAMVWRICLRTTK